jgi:hypothetical protein
MISFRRAILMNRVCTNPTNAIECLRYDADRDFVTCFRRQRHYPSDVAVSIDTENIKGSEHASENIPSTRLLDCPKLNTLRYVREAAYGGYLPIILCALSTTLVAGSSFDMTKSKPASVAVCLSRASA